MEPLRDLRALATRVGVCVAVALAACSGGSDGPGGPGEQRAALTPEEAAASVAVLDAPALVITAEDPGSLSVAASQALFDAAPVVGLASAADPDVLTEAARRAGTLGIPLLLAPDPGPAGNAAATDASPDQGTGPAAATDGVTGAPTDPPEPAADAAAAAGPVATGTDADAPGGSSSPGSDTTGRPVPRLSPGLVDELGRLGATTLLTFGADEPGELVGLPDGTVALDGPTALDAGTAPDEPAAAAEADAALRNTSSSAATVALVDRDDPLRDAATAVATAAGLEVLTVVDGDPRAGTEAREALARTVPDHVVALGSPDRFGSDETLAGLVATAVAGTELPGGGQVLFPGRQFFALYGHPGTPVLGILGEQPVDAAVARAREVAAPYERLSDVPVVPTFELIATIASASAGADGDYSSESAVDHLRPWVDAAGEAGMYVVLDLQPGHTDFLTQAKLYEELLHKPHVGLALDPEWRLAPGQRHMQVIGSVGIDEVNATITWLRDLVREHALPQKLLVVHQFRLSMIEGREQIATPPEVAVLFHMDGNGTAGQKMETWRTITAELPADTWLGWKNFIDEDAPMWTPEQTAAVEPTPDYVSYQ